MDIKKVENGINMGNEKVLDRVRDKRKILETIREKVDRALAEKTIYL